VSSTLSVLAVPLTLIAARRRLSWPAALAVAGCIALSRPLLIESVRGLRTELELCEVLVLYLAVERPLSVSIGRPMFAGLLGAALALTRTFYLPVIGVATIIGALSRKRSIRAAAGAILVSLAIVGSAVIGHRVAMYERQNDALFDVAGYTRWLANYEKFLLGHSLQHLELFPTEAEYLANGLYYGPRISTFQYLFQIHTAEEVVVGTVAGFADIFKTSGGLYLGESPTSRFAAEALDQIIRWVALLGLVALLVRSVRKRSLADLLLPAIVIVGFGSTAFLYHLGVIEMQRNTIQFFPLALIAGGWLVEAILHQVRARTLSRSPVAAVGDNTRSRRAPVAPDDRGS